MILLARSHLLYTNYGIFVPFITIVMEFDGNGDAGSYCLQLHIEYMCPPPPSTHIYIVVKWLWILDDFSLVELHVKV